MEFLVLSGKLFVFQKMKSRKRKNDLSQKIHRNMIFSVCLVKTREYNTNRNNM